MELEDTARKRARESFYFLLRMKRARVSGVVGQDPYDGPDRLSSLPDCLLHSIMSFLRARQAVQTCVLSTRWRHLWRSVPSLDINFDEFKNKTPEDGSEDDDDRSSSEDDDASDSDTDSGNTDPDNNYNNYNNYNNHHKDFKHLAKYKHWEGFEDFAVTLMRRCNIAQLDSFRLHIDPTKAPKFGNRVAAGWLRRAMKCCTPNLGGQHGVRFGTWRLKSLHLCNLLLDIGFMERVNSVCRSLEDLELDGCGCPFESITSKSLKTLVLKNCAWLNLSEIISPTLKTLVIDSGSNNDDAALVILAPSVVYLHLSVYVNNFKGGVLLNEMPSVAKALIRLPGHLFDSGESKLMGDQFKLLCSISNSTVLELRGVSKMVLGKEPRIQEFKNLRYLLLAYCDLTDEFKTLVFFIQSSPILEKLTLRGCEFPEYAYKRKGAPLLNKPSSSKLSGLDLLCEDLKVEIIYNFGHGARLIKVLRRIFVNLSIKNIKLTRVK